MKFLDLHAQYRRLQPGIDKRIQSVMETGAFIMGSEVGQLEEELSKRVGGAECVTCASGTDALLMILMGLGVGSGDAVFLPSFTFVATAEVVSLLGAKPIFVEVASEKFNICPQDLNAKIKEIESLGDENLKPKCVISVDMFGEPAENDALMKIAAKYGLEFITDAAQSFGSIYDNRPTGSIAPYTAVSFFPAKPLGCCGDGGAIFCKDKEFADILRSIRVHGKGSHKYENVRVGVNSRLDTLQAAVLLSKLEIFDDELNTRDQIARRYNQALATHVGVPAISDSRTSAWAQYTILTDQRDELKAYLGEQGIPVQVYYDPPLHLQPVYKDDESLPITENLSGRVLSLPVHPYLTLEEQEILAQNISAFFNNA